MNEAGNADKKIADVKQEIEQYFIEQNSVIKAVVSNIAEIRNEMQEIKVVSWDDKAKSVLGISSSVNGLLCILVVLLISAVVYMQMTIVEMDNKIKKVQSLMTILTAKNSEYDLCSQDLPVQANFIIDKLENDFKNMECVSIKKSTDSAFGFLLARLLPFDFVDVVTLKLRSSELQIAPVIVSCQILMD